MEKPGKVERELAALRNYVVPRLARIGRDEETEALYAAEHKASEGIQAAARELLKLAEGSEAEYWTRFVPAELFAVLESFDHRASIAAALGYLAYYCQRNSETVGAFLGQETYGGHSYAELFTAAAADFEHGDE